MDLNTLYNEMIAAEQALQPYQDANAVNTINQQVESQWSPLLTQAATDVKNQMSTYLPEFMNTAYKYGTDANDLSAQQKMSLMGRELGTLAGNLSYSSNLGSYLGGKMGEMQQKALQAWQLGQQAAADAYSRAFNRYQLAWQAEENRKSRALQQQQIAAQNQMYQDSLNQDPTNGFEIKTEDGAQTESPWYQPFAQIGQGIKNTMSSLPKDVQGMLIGGALGGPLGIGAGYLGSRMADNLKNTGNIFQW